MMRHSGILCYTWNSTDCLSPRFFSFLSFPSEFLRQSFSSNAEFLMHGRWKLICFWNGFVFQDICAVDGTVVCLSFCLFNFDYWKKEWEHLATIPKTLLFQLYFPVEFFMFINKKKSLNFHCTSAGRYLSVFNDDWRA